MAKQFRIDLLINSQQADAAAAKTVANQEKIAAAALKAAAAAERASQKTADAALKASEREAAMKQRIGDRMMATENRRGIAAEKAAEKAGAAALKAAERGSAAAMKAGERDAAMKQRIADRILAAENRRGIAGERAEATRAAAKLKASEREAAQRLKIGDRFLSQEHGRMVAAEKEKLALTARMEKAKAALFSQTTKEAATIGAAAAALLARQVAGSLSQAIDSSADKAKTVSEKYAGTQGSLRELANLQGRSLGGDFSRDFGKFNVATGMTPAESVNFQTQLLNSGAQYIGEGPGSNMDTGESREYTAQAAKLTLARGLTTDVAGDLAGRVLGLTDYKKHGTRGSEVALGRLNAPLAILDAGVGRAAMLASQFSMLMGTAYSEDEAKGAFSSEEEMASVLSVQAQKNPGRAFTGVRAAMRGVRDFDNPLIQKAGITPMTGFQDAIRMLAPVVEAEATAKGVKPVDVLNEAFEDDLTAEGIGTQIEQGVNQGLYQKRADVGRLARGPEQALAKVAGYEQTDESMRRRAVAEGELVDIERGERTSKPDILRVQATNELRREGKLDTTGSEFKKFLSGSLSFGMLPDLDRMNVDARAAEILNRRSPRGVPDLEFGGLFPTVSTEARTEAMNETMARTVGAGGDPMRDMVDVMKENNGLLRENNRLMQREPGGVTSSLVGNPGAAPGAGPMR